MKTLTCKQLGGLCTTKITASTREEMQTKGMMHLKDAHPEMAETISKLSTVHPKMISWRKEFKKTWEETPNN